MTESQGSEVDLEAALMRALPRRSSRRGRERAFWKRPDDIAGTFQYVFELVRQTLGVREEDRELGSAHYSQNRHGVALYYYHSDIFLSATCSQAGKELTLTQFVWAQRWLGELGYQARKNVKVERPESTLSVSVERGGWRLREEDCAAIRAIFGEACRLVGGEGERA